MGHDHDPAVHLGQRRQPPAGFPRPLVLGVGDVPAGMNEQSQAVRERPSGERQAERSEVGWRQVEFADEWGDRDVCAGGQPARRFDGTRGIAGHDHPCPGSNRLKGVRRPVVRVDPGGIIGLAPSQDPGPVDPARVHVRRAPMPHQYDSSLLHRCYLKLGANFEYRATLFKKEMMQ